MTLSRKAIVEMGFFRKIAQCIGHAYESDERLAWDQVKVWIYEDQDFITYKELRERNGISI